MRGVRRLGHARPHERDEPQCPCGAATAQRWLVRRCEQQRPSDRGVVEQQVDEGLDSMARGGRICVRLARRVREPQLRAGGHVIVRRAHERFAVVERLVEVALGQPGRAAHGAHGERASFGGAECRDTGVEQRLAPGGTPLRERGSCPASGHRRLLVRDVGASLVPADNAHCQPARVRDRRLRPRRAG